MTNKIVGVFGGAFDPVHKGHVLIAEQCINKIGMDKIIIIPTGISPFNKNLNDENIRISLAKIAFPDKKYEISDYELTQSKINKKPSYSINTLKFLTKQSASTHIFIIGADTLKTFNQWYEWEQILDYCHLLVISREEEEINIDILAPTLRDFILSNKVDDFMDLSNKNNGNIYFAKFPLLPFSSKIIRTRISQNKSIKNLVTPEVLEFINKTSCYKSGGHEI